MIEGKRVRRGIINGCGSSPGTMECDSYNVTGGLLSTSLSIINNPNKTPAVT